MDIPRFWYSCILVLGFIRNIHGLYLAFFVSFLLMSRAAEPTKTVGSALGGAGVIIDPSLLAYPLDLPTYLPVSIEKRKQFFGKSFF